MSLFDLKGRVAVVTGGNGGIGLGMARGMAEAGAAIKEIDWDEDYMILRHDSGKDRVLLDPVFKPFVERLLELNPMIKVSDDLRSSLEEEARA